MVKEVIFGAGVKKYRYCKVIKQPIAVCKNKVMIALEVIVCSLSLLVRLYRSFSLLSFIHIHILLILYHKTRHIMMDLIYL